MRTQLSATRYAYLGVLLAKDIVLPPRAEHKFTLPLQRLWCSLDTVAAEEVYEWPWILVLGVDAVISRYPSLGHGDEKGAVS